MKVLLDLNVLLDVVQNRAPHYHNSAQVLSLARVGEIQAVLPVHAFTTLYYILAKAAGKAKAEQAVDWLLAHFEVAEAGREHLVVPRVLEHGGLRAGARVIADEQGPVEAPTDALHHAVRRRRTGDEHDGVRKPRGVEVASVVVGIAHDDLPGSGGEAAGQHRVQVGAHVAARRLGGRPAARRVLLGDDTGDAFEVDGDEQSHEALPAAPGGGRGARARRGTRRPRRAV